MTYDNWVIGGLTPSWISTIEPTPNRTNPHFTIRCVSDTLYNGGIEPRVETAQFEALICDKVNNVPLINGGTKLQAVGDIITITDGVNTWDRAAITNVTYPSDGASAHRIIYDIEVEVEIDGGGGSYAYTPDYSEYDNVDYYFFYDPGPPEQFDTYEGDIGVTGTELGWMEITETRNVVRVEIYGSGDAEGSYVEVNGERREWQYYEADDGIGVPQLQLHTWDLDIPTDVITIKSSKHWESVNLGFYADYIRVIYE